MEDNNAMINEYPIGKMFVEMILVEMLSEDYSWHDKQKIADALYSIRRCAKQMKEEKIMYEATELQQQPKDE